MPIKKYINHKIHAVSTGVLFLLFALITCAAFPNTTHGAESDFAQSFETVTTGSDEQCDFMMINRSVLICSSTIIFLLLAGMGAALIYFMIALKKRSASSLSLDGHVGVINKQEWDLYQNAEKDAQNELASAKFFSNIPDIDYRELSKAVKNVFETGKSTTVDYEYKSIKRIFTAMLLRKGAEGTKSVIWFTQNNTGLHDAKRKAEEQAQWLHLTLNSIGDGVITTDAQGCIVMINPVAARMTGVSQAEAVGKPHDEIFNIVSAVDEEPIESPVMRTLRTGIIVELANHTDLLSRDGGRYHIADSSAPIIDNVGKIIGAILVFRDVTENYMRRDNLKKLITSLEYASELTNSAAFEIYPATRRITGSKKIKELWPVNQDGTAVDVTDWVCAEDREKVDAEWSAVITGKKSDISVDYRAMKDGATHYYRLKGAIDNTNKKKSCIIGVLQDVTEITSSILNLKGDLELWTRVIDTLPVMIFAKDVAQDFRYVQCNQAFFDFCGCHEADVIGHTDQEILPESVEQIHKYDVSISESGELCHFKTEWKDRKGVPHPLKIVKKLFVDPRGRKLLIGAATDITELNHVIKNEQAIKEVLAKVILDSTFEDTFRKISIDLSDLLNCERIVLGKCDDEGHLRFEAEWHKYGMSDLTSYPLECIYKTWDEHVDKLRCNELFVCDDETVNFVNSTYNPSGLRDRMLQSVTAAPIFINDRYWGTLFVSFIEKKHHFSESDKTLIAAMADILAMAQTREMQRLKIEQANQEKQLLLDNINMPVWLHDGKGELLWANAKVSEIPNFPAGHLTTEENQKIFCKNLPADVVYPVSKVIETKQEAVTRISFGGRDYATWTRPVFDEHQQLIYIVKSAIDITDLNKSTQAQRVLNLGLETFLAEEDMKKAFLIFLEEIQRFFGCARCYIMAFDAEKHTGTTIAECVAEGYPKMWEDIVNYPYTLSGNWLIKAAEKRSLVICPDTRTEETKDFFGSWYPLIEPLKSYYGAAIYFEGKFWGILGISFDCYNHELAQPEIDFMKMLNDIFVLYFTHTKAEKQVRDALTQAQNAAKAKSFFLASVSHEIRTPLNAVIGFSELLSDEKLPSSERNEYLSNVIYSGKALLQLINDVLDLSKLEADQMQIRLEPTDFNELCNENIRLFERTAQEKMLKLQTRISVPSKLILDKLRIRQILFNLIGNAVKFTLHGSVSISAKFIYDNETTGTLNFSVADTGIGISESDQTKMLEPFVQLSKMRGTNAANNGTGLGLSICKRLIEKMNGELLIESSEGIGSAFTVVLHNVKYSADNQFYGSEKYQQTIQADTIDSTSILLVDDVQMNLKVMSAIFHKLGVENIACAMSGEEALAKLQKQTFQMVMTDMWMPEMNGAELACAIHALKQYHNTPIIAVTADVDANGTFPMKDFAGIILKPATSAKCKEMLEKLISKTS